MCGVVYVFTFTRPAMLESPNSAGHLDRQLVSRVRPTSHGRIDYVRLCVDPTVGYWGRDGERRRQQHERSSINVSNFTGVVRDASLKVGDYK